MSRFAYAYLSNCTQKVTCSVAPEASDPTLKATVPVAALVGAIAFATPPTMVPTVPTPLTVFGVQAAGVVKKLV